MKKEVIKDILYMTAGSMIYAVSVDVFTTPFGIAPGGVTGISIVLNKLLDTPVGLMIVLLNLPLFLFSFKFFGKNFIVKSIMSTLLASVFIDVFAQFLPAFNGDGLLSSIYAGVTSGLGLSMIFLRGGTTGGTDISARLLHRFIPYVSIGKFILIVDSVIILSSAVVFKSVNSALYAIIIIFTSTTIIDKIISGAESGKMILIISEKNAEIKQKLLNLAKRGITVIDAQGGYSGEKTQIIMCVARVNETTQLIRLVKETDSNAFVIVDHVGSVLGNGFEGNPIN